MKNTSRAAYFRTLRHAAWLTAQARNARTSLSRGGLFQPIMVVERMNADKAAARDLVAKARRMRLG